MDLQARATCVRCHAPRASGQECPRCGVIYAKAEAHLSRQAPEMVERALALPPSESPWVGDRNEARLELRIRTFAIPAALVLASLAVSVPVFRMLVRVFFSMWIHELGHAVTAWLCGFAAFPGPWFTPVWESRSPVVSLLLAAGIAFAGYKAWVARRFAWVAAAGGLLLLQLSMTLGLSTAHASALILFGGDAGCMVLGTCLIATMYAGSESSLRRGWLRWGFLVIGAASLMDSFKTWWAAKTDAGEIPFGINEGMGLSDSSKLVDGYGWTEAQLVHRYVMLGIGCAIVLGVIHAVNLWRALAEMRDIS